MFNDKTLTLKEIGALKNQEEFIIYLENGAYGFGPYGMLFVFSSFWKLFGFLGPQAIRLKVQLIKKQDLKSISTRAILNPENYKILEIIDFTDK